MADDYVARDPRTGKIIQQRKKSVEMDIRSLQPSDGPWQRIPIFEILKLAEGGIDTLELSCLLYTSPSPRDGLLSRMPSSA